LEGGDQYRGWFHSSLLVAAVTSGAAPYRSVLTHGWVLDAEGRAMSKSLGNVVDPNEVIKTHGAEILRLWVASVDFREDVVISPDILSHLSEAYRKLRNTFRYCLGNLYDFDPSKDLVNDDHLEEIDSWALARSAALLRRARADYVEYNFHKVYRAIYDFATVDLSAIYFDILKDRLYTFPARSRGRRSAQPALHRLALALVRLVAPILPFTAEEVWARLARRPGDLESVHLALFPSPEELEARLPVEKIANWESLLLERDQVLKALEIARRENTIASSLEAKVILSAAGDRADLLEQYIRFLPALFIVSQVEVRRRSVRDLLATPGPRSRPARTDTLPTRPEVKFPGAVPPEWLEDLDVQVVRADGQKCARCWNYSEHVGEDRRYPTVCERCSEALREIEARPS
jgi:isoleucyl-tRNA synthetase